MHSQLAKWVVKASLLCQFPAVAFQECGTFGGKKNGFKNFKVCPTLNRAQSEVFRKHFSKQFRRGPQVAFQSIYLLHDFTLIQGCQTPGPGATSGPQITLNLACN